MKKRIMQQIVRRTNARIKSLEVEITEDLVTIRGCAPCYYVKQLALQGVFDVLGPSHTTQVELNVHVSEPATSEADSP
jgi:hypothetical protein